VIREAMDFADQRDWTVAAALSMPLLYTAEGVAPSKAKVVETFEALASQCGMPLLSPDRLRLYGGHSARVTGAQALAAHGIDVNKIRILARHSGEAILRYVADAPLKTLRSDLGLPPTSAAAAASASTGLHPSHRDTMTKLQSALSRLDAHDADIAALRTLASNAPAIIYVQNTESSAIHALRSTDAAHTICGWHVGLTRKGKSGVRWLSSTSSEPWWLLCEKCLLPVREAGKLLAAECEQELSE
jgi:hypothetical protein